MSDDQVLSGKEAQKLWDEEAVKLDAGSDEPADGDADVPETPQETPEPAKEPEDPLAGLPQIVRDKLALIDKMQAENAQLQHHVRTTEGRVAAMQREQAQRKTQETAAPTAAAIAKAGENPEKWKEIKRDFPEWAEAMEEYVGSRLGSASSNQGLSPEQVAEIVNAKTSELRAESMRAVEFAKLEARHPDWDTKRSTPEFAAWKAVQAPDVQSLADSPKAADAIKMLDLFEASRAKPTAQGIRENRKANLSVAATPKQGDTAAIKQAEAVTMEELWNSEARKREKTREARGY